MQCFNMRLGGNDPSWKCESNLIGGNAIQNVDITCEGYDYDGDGYILRGSCHLEYMLREKVHQTLSPGLDTGNTDIFMIVLVITTGCWALLKCARSVNGKRIL